MKYNSIKQLFFNGVEKLSAICIICTLFGCCYYLGTAAYEFSSINDLELNINIPTYENFNEKLSKTAEKLDNITIHTRQHIPSVDEVKMECTPILEEIIKVIFKIANNTGQILPRESVTDKIYDRCVITKEYIPIKENLKNLLSELNKYNENHKNILSYDILDPQYSLWTDFLEFYFKNIDNNIKKHKNALKEQNNINNEHQLNIDKNILDAKMLFFALCLCILFFAIISIERNTKAILSLRETLENENK